MSKCKVVFVQPVQSPYWTERLKVLSQSSELDLVLLLEHGGFSHRPGWAPIPIEGVIIDVMGSALLGVQQNNADLGYSIKGVRSIAWRLPVKLLNYRPQIVVVCNATQLLLSILLRPFLGYRIILNVEDTLHATRRHGARTRGLRSWVYRQADRFLAFSDEAEIYLRSIGVSSPVDRTSWSLDMAKFHAMADVSQENATLVSNEAKKMNVLFVGQLVPGKGPIQLLRSWARLPRSIRSTASLKIVGIGPLADEAKALAESLELHEVEFAGSRPYSDMPAIYASADLFILPTLQDLYSLTVLEAMACSCPVITTPYNGAKELVIENETGWIVDPTDIDALEKVLEQALANPQHLANMRSMARQRVAQMDNLVVMSRLKETFFDVAGRSLTK